MDKQTFIRLAAAGIMAGCIATTGCEQSTSAPASTTPTTSTGITGARTTTEFQAECTKIAGQFKAHDCSGLNECKGHSFMEGKGVAKHDCKGLATCKGGSCVES